MHFKCSKACLSVKSSLMNRFFPLFTGISHHLRNFPIFYRPFTFKDAEWACWSAWYELRTIAPTAACVKPIS